MAEGKGHTELMPCPFCGGEGRHEPDGRSPGYWIQCQQCHAQSDDRGSPEMAALADATKRYRMMGDQKVYSGEHVANILQHWTDRLSATSPGDAVREALEQFIVENDSEDADDECELCDGRGTVDAFTKRTNGGRFEGRDEIGCPACAERFRSRQAKAAIAPAEKPGDERTIDPLTDCMNVALLIENGCDEKFARHIVNQWNEKCRTAAPTPPSADVDETGWLIEKDDPPVYHLVTDDFDEHWTPDASKALRFARRDDAQAYVDHVGWTSPPVRVAEHMWPIQSAAHGGGTESDGGGKVGSSPALASEGQQRVHEHGVMPVGDTAANMDSIGAGPSDTRPDCSNLSYLKQPFPSDPAQEPITDLEWLAAHQSLALSFDGFGDDDPAWKVHQVTGGRNDREWNLVGSGDTPANALKAARFALIEGRT